MKLKDVMSTDVQVVEADATLQRAAELMRDFDIGMLPVKNSAGHLVGALTDRDIVVRAIADGQDPYQILVHEIMTGQVVQCEQEQDLAVAVRLMEEKQIRRLIVTDAHNRPVGMVALSDLALHQASRDLSQKVLEVVSRPGQEGQDRPYEWRKHSMDE